jgi:hypothetical protein
MARELGKPSRDNIMGFSMTVPGVGRFRGVPVLAAKTIYPPAELAIMPRIGDRTWLSPGFRALRSKTLDFLDHGYTAIDHRQVVGTRSVSIRLAAQIKDTWHPVENASVDLSIAAVSTEYAYRG